MKRILTICIIAVCCITAGYAQKAKFGHVDYGTVMKEMPGIDTAQQALMTYQQELEAVGKQMADEFKTKQAEYANLTSTTTSSAILKVKVTRIYDTIRPDFHVGYDTVLVNVKLVEGETKTAVARMPGDTLWMPIPIPSQK